MNVILMMSMSEIRIDIIEVIMCVYSMVECVMGIDWNCLKMLFCRLRKR